MTVTELHEKLKDVYCEVANQREADHLFKLCRDVCPDARYTPNDKEVTCGHIYFMSLTGIPLFIGIETHAPRLSSKITYTEMVNKIKGFSDQKNENNLKLTDKELLFLRVIIGVLGGDEARKMIKSSFLAGDNLNALDISDLEEISNSSYAKLNQLIEENKITDKVFKVEKPKAFEFRCGLTATKKGGLIKIGCRTFTKEFLLEKYLPIFGLVDKIEVEDNTFHKEECLEFANILEEW